MTVVINPRPRRVKKLLDCWWFTFFVGYGLGLVVILAFVLLAYGVPFFEDGELKACGPWEPYGSGAIRRCTDVGTTLIALSFGAFIGSFIILMKRRAERAGP